MPPAVCAAEPPAGSKRSRPAEAEGDKEGRGPLAAASMTEAAVAARDARVKAEIAQAAAQRAAAARRAADAAAREAAKATASVPTAKRQRLANSASDNVFTVERLIDRRWKGMRWQYLVRWAGFDDAHDT